ncbi:MAG: glutamine synthetase, partial [Firmicutes bacterium]|nr:glutamine synthetase [Bacillota bacterium]
TTDAINRLKPGYEAPVSIVTSLGPDVLTPSRNRSVLACVIRDPEKPLATRFELRSPNPKSNTYMVLAACMMAMLDGIKAVLAAGKDPDELLASLSKSAEDEDFYLETGRVYRTEQNIFEDYTKEERDRLFGRTPATAWENIHALDVFPEKVKVLENDMVFSALDLASFRAAALDSWVMELHDRIVPELRDRVRRCKKRHSDADCTDLDAARYSAIRIMQEEIARDSADSPSLLTRLSRALEDKDYQAASDLQLQTVERVQALEAVYAEYCRNIL